MSWELLIYFLGFVLQAALIGITMYQVPRKQLDLPHAAAERCTCAGLHQICV